MGEQVKAELGQIWKNQGHKSTQPAVSKAKDGWVWFGNDSSIAEHNLLDPRFGWSLVGLELDDGRRVMVGERYEPDYGPPGSNRERAHEIVAVLSGGRVETICGSVGYQVKASEVLESHRKLDEAPKATISPMASSVTCAWKHPEAQKILEGSSGRMPKPEPAAGQVWRFTGNQWASPRPPKAIRSMNSTEADFGDGTAASIQWLQKSDAWEYVGPAGTPTVELTRISAAIGESESFRRAAEKICNGTPPIVPGLRAAETLGYPPELAQAETLRATRQRTSEQRARGMKPDPKAGQLWRYRNHSDSNDPSNRVYNIVGFDSSGRSDLEPYGSATKKGLLERLSWEYVGEASERRDNPDAVVVAPANRISYAINCGGGKRIAESSKQVKLAAEDAAKATSRKLIDNAIRAYAGPHPRAFMAAMVAMGEHSDWEERHVDAMSKGIWALESYLQRGFSAERAQQEAFVSWVGPGALFDVYLRERNRK